jgi:hypothetical protein
MGDKWAKPIIGKTIASASVVKDEAADSCFYAVLELAFTDGSKYSMSIYARPEVHGIFFKSDEDDKDAKEVMLVKP